MSLSSQLFLFVVLPLVLLVYTLAPRRSRTLLLALASYLFYAWANPLFVLLLLGVTAVDFTCGMVISGQAGRRRGEEIQVLDSGSPRTRRQRLALLVSLATDLGALAFFKYAGFAADNIASLVGAFGGGPLRLEVLAGLALPLGISFFTFKSMTYTIDVYRGHAKATSSFVAYASFVAAFPQLLAGPIWRWSDAEPQVHQGREVSVAGMSRGAMLFALGLGKKVLLADPIGGMADLAFGAGSIGVVGAWIGALAFTLQIYFDFSGYSDMAIGLGEMLGFRYPTNFNAPYRAASITEFWRRWHISLSTWFRDYLFLPVAYATGRRLGRRELAPRLEEMLSYTAGALVTMLLCGLWHGASWTFVAWGGLLGIALVGERALARAKLYRAIPGRAKVLLTFILIVLTWVVFRSPSLPDAWRYLASLVGLSPLDGSAALFPGVLLTPGATLALLLGGAIVLWGRPSQDLVKEPSWPGMALATAVLACALAVVFQQSFRPFLYSVF